MTFSLKYRLSQLISLIWLGRNFWAKTQRESDMFLTLRQVYRSRSVYLLENEQYEVIVSNEKS